MSFSFLWWAAGWCWSVRSGPLVAAHVVLLPVVGRPGAGRSGQVHWSPRMSFSFLWWAWLVLVGRVRSTGRRACRSPSCGGPGWCWSVGSGPLVAAHVVLLPVVGLRWCWSVRSGPLVATHALLLPLSTQANSLSNSTNALTERCGSARLLQVWQVASPPLALLPVCGYPLCPQLRMRGIFVLNVGNRKSLA